MVGTGTAMQAIPYSPGLGTKQLLWLANCGMIALAVAPIGFLGGSIAIRAGWYTAGKCFFFFIQEEMEGFAETSNEFIPRQKCSVSKSL